MTIEVCNLTCYRNLMQGILFEDLVGYGKLDGLLPEKEKVVVYVQYITGKSQNMRFGCLLCIVNLSVQQSHLIFLNK